MSIGETNGAQLAFAQMPLAEASGRSSATTVRERPRLTPVILEEAELGRVADQFKRYGR